MIRRTSTITLGGVTLGAAALLLGSGTALAGHDHFVVTPDERCHQVAAGQTGIDDTAHGGYHRFHFNVHWGATENDAHEVLGNGNSQVDIVTRCD
jgi:hypothetical protein